ncbi:MAG: patatin-like phospholipase family protein [Patescibacteria group bacterium]|nr:patatin-like phospholipase family protein [Patescibacteria group bacterium]
MSRAVRASISIPVTFEPVEIDGKYYVDGGVRVNFPVLKAQRL